MKKVLALVLAFVMVAGMSVVAFANQGDVKYTAPKIDTNPVDKDGNAIVDVIPGTTYYFELTVGNKTVEGASTPTDDVVSTPKATDYTVSAKASEDGKAVFSKASIVKLSATGNYYVKVETNDNRKLDAQTLTLELSLVGKTALTKEILNKATPDTTFKSVAVFTKAEFKYPDCDASGGYCSLVEKKSIAKFKDATDAEWVDMTVYAGDCTFESRMYKQGDLFIGYTDAKDDKIEELYGDKAALDYFWFTMPKGFKQAGTLTIEYPMLDGDKVPYLYEIKEGKPVEIKNAYDKDAEAFVLKGVKTLGKYVVSDMALEVKAAEGGNEANPETGANDVVAIAAGLAVISLVAAGAVSLKK